MFKGPLELAFVGVLCGKQPPAAKGDRLRIRLADTPGFVAEGLKKLGCRVGVACADECLYEFWRGCARRCVTEEGRLAERPSEAVDG